jgi:quinol monooxygenase YgiN
MKYALLNKLTAKPGNRDELVAILLESGKLGESNPACILYIVSESVEDPNVVWVQDLWTSKEQHAASLKLPELRPFINQAMPLLEGPPEQIEIRPVGGKGT